MIAQLNQAQNKQTYTKAQRKDQTLRTPWTISPKERKLVEEGIHASHHVDERSAFRDTRQGESGPPSTGDLEETRRKSAVKQNHADEEQFTKEPSSRLIKSHTRSTIPQRRNAYNQTRHRRSSCLKRRLSLMIRRSSKMKRFATTTRRGSVKSRLRKERRLGREERKT